MTMNTESGWRGALPPSIVADAALRDAEAHAGLRLGLEYMDRERTEVMEAGAVAQMGHRMRFVRPREVSIDLFSADVDLVDGRNVDTCEHLFQRTYAQVGSLQMTWWFLYCEHRNEAIATAPAPIRET